MKKKSSNFKYFLSEGFKSFTTNGLMSLASTIIVVASLVVLGIYLLFSMNINYIARQFEEESEIQVWIDESVPAGGAEMQDVENSIKAVPNVNEVKFFSKEEALADYKEQLGADSEYLDGFDADNPLRDSFKVTLYDISLAEETSAEFAKIKEIANISDNRTSMNKLVLITNVVKHISFWFMLFLGALAVFIISNTIKITLFARRRDINIMKYIGATDSFISWPFIVEGVFIGLFGAAVSLILVSLGYGVFVAQEYVIFKTIEFCSLGQVLLPMICWFAGIGGLLGAFGSAISIRRHLKV